MSGRGMGKASLGSVPNNKHCALPFGTARLQCGLSVIHVPVVQQIPRLRSSALSLRAAFGSSLKRLTARVTLTSWPIPKRVATRRFASAVCLRTNAATISFCSFHAPSPANPSTRSGPCPLQTHSSRHPRAPSHDKPHPPPHIAMVSPCPTISHPSTHVNVCYLGLTP